MTSFEVERVYTGQNILIPLGITITVLIKVDKAFSGNTLGWFLLFGDRYYMVLIDSYGEDMYGDVSFTTCS